MMKLLFFTLFFLCFSLAGQAQTLCFAQAENYYEQLYCQLLNESSSSGLPSFADFRKNNPITQALLLKRPAGKIGIVVNMPKRNSTERGPAQAPNRKSLPVAVSADAGNVLGECDFGGNGITCGTTTYTLVGNLNNGRLTAGALTENNRMGLPNYRGSLADEYEVSRFLHQAYLRYINKMMEIGLGGVTMSYGKFVYLFDDLLEKRVNFSERFETMYSFLKKDKRALRVTEALDTDPDLSLVHCGPLDSSTIVCATGTRNYVYKSHVNEADADRVSEE